MNAKMLKVLEDCIEKRWNLIAAGCNVYKLPACHLCISSGKSCEGCPVDIKTGYGCDETPFLAWINSNIRSPEYWDATEDEIEFLVSLLPKNHRLRKE